MNKKNNKQILWSAGSSTSIYAFVNLSAYTGLAQLELSFPAYAIMMVFNIVIFPSFFLFLELSEYRGRLWNFWKSIPLAVHKGICFLCLFWITFISLKGLIPAIKKDYERNQP